LEYSKVELLLLLRKAELLLLLVEAHATLVRWLKKKETFKNRKPPAP